jgi:hypothetical protein
VSTATPENRAAVIVTLNAVNPAAASADPAPSTSRMNSALQSATAPSPTAAQNATRPRTKIVPSIRRARGLDRSDSTRFAVGGSGGSPNRATIATTSPIPAAATKCGPIAIFAAAQPPAAAPIIPPALKAP